MNILFIGNRPEDGKTVSHMLRGTGYHLVMAPNARVGLMSALKEMPNIIIMDFELRGINGLQAIAMLKMNPRLKDAAVIALMDEPHPSHQKWLTHAGCDAVIHRPLDRTVLLMAIRSTSGTERV